MTSMPRLVSLVLAALAVLVLCILAILDTDAIWLVLATVVSIALIGVVVAIDVWRVAGAAGDDADSSEG
jgi:hypothetical protein